MNDQHSKYPFSMEEWQICLKVLTHLKEQPLENPDNLAFSGLISKIYKKAKKLNRSHSFSEKRIQDLSCSQKSNIAQTALSGRMYYTHQDNPQSYSPLCIPKSCYCCQRKYTLLHSFYSRLCPNCAELNYQQRKKSVDLSGRYAIVTGGRVKIGYATTLKLLRSGTYVVITTRFPALLLEQLQQEKDYAIWQNKYYIYGLDLRNLSSIYTFIEFYRNHFPSLDIVINNAAQTIRYPDSYYLPLIEREQYLLTTETVPKNLIENTTAIISHTPNIPYFSIPKPISQLTRFGQPVDERDKNSWNSKLDEIELEELLEVNLINHIAPYILIKELKSLLVQSQFNERFIINVTSSEGIFSYTNKTIHHPHTNMTKAALNMMTLTSAQEFAKDQIYMCAVDVGWVSTGVNENLRKQQFAQGYIPPLDPVDGASRILHPIIQGLNGEYLYGILLKNYKIHTW